jgi:hypothetical protein
MSTIFYTRGLELFATPNGGVQIVHYASFLHPVLFETAEDYANRAVLPFYLPHSYQPWRYISSREEQMRKSRGPYDAVSEVLADSAPLGRSWL